MEDKGCAYCGKKANGAMLAMADKVAHTTCVIGKLNELLDPDWGEGDTREPMKIVGYLAGYVKLAEDQTLPIIDPHQYDSPEDVRMGMDNLVDRGWWKVELEERQ